MIRSLGVGLPSPENRLANTFIVPPSPKLQENEPEYPRVCAVLVHAHRSKLSNLVLLVQICQGYDLVRVARLRLSIWHLRARA
eukprot:3304461-Rhodomonas_salina.1